MTKKEFLQAVQQCTIEETVCMQLGDNGCRKSCKCVAEVDMGRLEKLLDENAVAIKPPIGIEPEYIHNGRRKQELKAAIMRYLNAHKEIPVEWLYEYNRLALSVGGDTD